jgi:hypothetical protein
MVVLRFNTIRLLARRSLTITPPSPKMQWQIESDANTRSRRREVSSQRSLSPFAPGSTNLWALQGAGGGCLSGGCAPRRLRGLVRPDRIADETTRGGGRSRLEPADAKKRCRWVPSRYRFSGYQIALRATQQMLDYIGFSSASGQHSTIDRCCRLTVCNSREPPARCKIRLCDIDGRQSHEGLRANIKAHWSREGASTCML